jgi:uncharacterized protein (DUF1697 family)
VETHGTTGNVAFETGPVGVTAALEAQISRHLKRSIDADIWTFIRTPKQLSELVADAPFSDDSESARFVVFMAEPLDDKTVRRLSVRRNENELLHPRGLEIYWERKRVADGGSPLALSNFIGSPATVRSFSTIKRLAADYGRHPRHEGTQPTESERSRQ